MFNVVAPALITSDRILYKNSGSDRPASSGENSISSHPRPRRYATAFTADATTSSGVIRSLYCIWISDVAMNVCTRGRFASLTASHAVFKSFSLVLDSPQMTGTYPSSCTSFPTSIAIAFTASKSSGDATGNPASMISTPSFDNCLAISSF